MRFQCLCLNPADVLHYYGLQQTKLAVLHNARAQGGCQPHNVPPSGPEGILIYIRPQLQHALHYVVACSLGCERHQAFLQWRARVDILDEARVDAARSSHFFADLRYISIFAQERKGRDLLGCTATMVGMQAGQGCKLGMAEEICDAQLHPVLIAAQPEKAVVQSNAVRLGVQHLHPQLLHKWTESI